MRHHTQKVKLQNVRSIIQQCFLVMWLFVLVYHVYAECRSSRQVQPPVRMLIRPWRHCWPRLCSVSNPLSTNPCSTANVDPPMKTITIPTAAANAYVQCMVWNWNIHRVQKRNASILLILSVIITDLSNVWQAVVQENMQQWNTKFAANLSLCVPYHD